MLQSRPCLLINNAAHIQGDSAAKRRRSIFSECPRGLAVRLATRHKSRLNSFVADGIAGNE